MMVSFIDLRLYLSDFFLNVVFFSERTMTTCTNEKLVVETDEGTYTIVHDDYIRGKCTAEKRCTELDSILAPLTTRSEFEAVMSAVTSCNHTDKYEYYFIGLSISSDNKHRVFSNGVAFDYNRHGDLYREHQVTVGKNCPEAYLNPLSTDKLEVSVALGCQDMPGHYVCLKPKSGAKSRALKGDTVNSHSSSFIFDGSFQFAIICFLICLVGFMYARIKKLKSNNSQKILL